MKLRWRRVRHAVVLALVLTMALPVVALADSGKKAYKKGVEYEDAQRWDKAADQFALALIDDPSNSEYKLHYFRSIANASIMLTQRGDTLAAQKDYNAAFQAYRQACTYDPSNELAAAKMQNMRKLLGLPQEEPGPESDLLKARYKKSEAGVTLPPSRRIKTDVVYHNASLRSVIDSLAESLGLNVIYDADFKDRSNFDFEARNVTKAKALELVLLTNKLFYVQADTRSVIIAPDQPQNRARYQNLSVRTFYLRNADVQDVRTLIQQIVATKYLVASKQLNALTVRDTPANLELIESIISSIDKDRAEVLVDVNLYEVDHSDLITFGNQFNVSDKGAGSLATFIGGVGQQDALRSITPAGAYYSPLGLALSLPTSQLTAFQSTGRTRLIASTQVHVLDNEQHTIRIGSRVPIQTAQISPQNVVVNSTGGGGGNNPNNNNNGVYGGYQPTTQYQYENVGLNIDIQPIVHEDLVQMKMKIETSDVASNTGVGGNPIFTQRSMSSVASIRDGQTTLIAGVAQENRSDGRQGLPLISLLPGIGRFFATPKKQSTLTDVVITVTPHILRAPVYRDSDHEATPAGTQTAPDRQIDIEDIIYRAEVEEAAAAAAPIASAPGAPPGTPPGAAAGARPKVTEVPLPLPGVDGTTRTVSAGRGEVISTPSGSRTPAPIVAPEDRAQPAPKPAALAPQPAPAADDGDDDDDDGPGAQGAFNIRLTGLQVGSVGKAMPVSVWASGSSRVLSAVIAIKFNEQLLRVNKVESTGLFDGKLGAKVPFEVRDGMLIVSMARSPDLANNPVNGQLLNITFDVIGQGAATLAVVPDASRLIGPDNAIAEVRFEGPLTVTTR